MAVAFPVDAVRRQFPALARQVAGRSAVFLDGPAGSQVPQGVIDAVGRALTEMNANSGGAFVTSVEADALRDQAHQAMADLLGAASASEVVFGANMTTLTLALSRALAKEWSASDEVLVTRLDHDANVSPWVLAARDAGSTVRHVEILRDECRLDLEDLQAKLTPRTRLLAVGAASNLVGTINPIAEIVGMAHAVGAEVFVDAVHYAPHRLLDVAAWDCDYLVCSAYKFFGPHLGVLWGRGARLDALPVYQVRPAPSALPGRWMTGTANVEGIAGARAAVEYLAWLGRTVAAQPLERRAALAAAFAAISAYERQLVELLVAGLAALPDVTIWGIAAPQRFADRTPTVAFTHARRSPREITTCLAERGFFVWDGNNYALPLTEALGLEPHGVVRVGLLHYNTAEEVTRLVAALAAFLG